jgi:DNA invertase Pin-like site-specific DNA recombinase
MPPVSERQRRAMQAAAHGHSTLGIPAKVGKQFSNADPGGKLPKSAPKPTHQGNHMRERKDAGRTTAQVAAEFGTSKTTAHRRLKAHDALRAGYTREERDD